MTTALTLKDYLKEFRKKVPLKRHFVKFALKDINDEGLCYGPYKQKKTGRKYIYLIVKKRMSVSLQVDVLMHEYAHALLMDRGKDYQDEQKDHGPEWGKCYSEVYRVFLKLIAAPI
jgi:plasmid replication initiation protein